MTAVPSGTRRSALPTLLLLALIGIAITCYGLIQSPISIDGGHPYDAASYHAMAEQVAAGEPISAVPPFTWRIALPFLAGSLFPDDLDRGFKLLNLLFATATLAVLYLYLRSFRLGVNTSLLLVLLFVCAPQSPFRFTHYVVSYADPPALFFIVTLLWLTQSVQRLDLLRATLITAFAVIGVLFREIALCGVLVFVFGQCLRVGRRAPFLRVTSWRKAGLCLMPLIAAAMTLVIVHSQIETSIDHSYVAQMQGVAATMLAQPDIFALAWMLSFGVIPLVLALGAFRGPIPAFLGNNPPVAAFLFGCTLLALFAGFHTGRIVFWAFPAILLLFGVFLEQHKISNAPLGWKLGFYLSLGIAQALAWRLWLPIPDTSHAELLDTEAPPLLALAAYGDVTLGHMYASTLPRASRLALLGQYIALAAYLGIVLYLANKRGTRS